MWPLLIALPGTYVLIAILLQFFPNIIFEGLFLNRLCPPRRLLHLNQPDKVYGLLGAKSLRLHSSSGNEIGVWHVPPLDYRDENLSNATKVVVYCHGNAFHRGFNHRVQLYKKFTKLGFHVVAFDYSGFGDSTGKPSISAVVEDAATVLKWSMEQVANKDCQIVVWGHSLGTHISTRALNSHCQKGRKKPDCLVLEAPFTTVMEAAECFPLSKISLTLYPFFKSNMQSTLRRHDSECSTVDALPSVPVPILIMHAEDDSRLDFDLGVKLYNATIRNPATKSTFIRFLQVDKRYEVKHYTAKFPEMQRLFQEFLRDVANLSDSDKCHEMIKV